MNLSRSTVQVDLSNKEYSPRGDTAAHRDHASLRIVHNRNWKEKAFFVRFSLKSVYPLKPYLIDKRISKILVSNSSDITVQ